MATERLSAEARREQILVAATEVFGALGYAAGTTDAIAKAAGISQAYVVRTFGSKENLLLEVAGRACAHIAAAFRSAVSTFDDSMGPLDRQARMGEAYKALVADRGLLLSLMHTYTLGHDPVIGPAAREGFLGIYRIVRDEAGLSERDAMAFMAQGMLIDTLMALRLTDSPDPDARELAGCAFDMDSSGLGVIAGAMGNAADLQAKR